MLQSDIQPLYHDHILHFTLGDHMARGRILRLKGSFYRALENQTYPQAITKLLGETAALNILLSSASKEDGIFTLQLQGDKDTAARFLVAERHGDYHYRLTARFDEKKVNIQGMDATNETLFGPKAFMVFTTDFDLKERYQGIAPLDHPHLDQSATSWLKQSDQNDALVQLHSLLDENQKPKAAFGLLLQPIATQDLTKEKQAKHQQAWEETKIFAQSLKKEEALDEELSLQEILIRLFHEQGVKLTDQKPLRFACRCSMEKVHQMINGLPMDQQKELFKESSEVSIDCEYCGKTYMITNEMDKI